MNHTNDPDHQVADKLLTYLRAELNNPHIDFAAPLTPILGGYEASTHHFQLNGVEPELTRPLVLRLYPEYRDPDHAVVEAVVQNELAVAGYPVPSVLLTSRDRAHLGGAFLIMDFMPGMNMMDAAEQNMPTMLGKAHAALHSIVPNRLLDSLKAQGFEEHRFRFNGHLNWLLAKVGNFPWLADSMQWLAENRPPEPEHLAICHGDFHPLNILVSNEQVTAVLDWGGFMIGDAAMDVAKTLVICDNVGRYLLPLDNWQELTPKYLAAYRNERPLDLRYLDYYRLLKCVMALIDGAEGQRVLTSPAVLKSLTDLVYAIAGIRVTVPGPLQ